MTFIPWTKTLQDGAGAPVSGATITVKVQSSGSNATIYANNSGGAKVNPFSTGSDGVVSFWGVPGVYTVEVNSGGNITSEDMVLSVDNEVQSSTTDSTFDRILLVGGFGLGADGSEAVANLDAFDIRAGFYSVDADTTGTRPSGSSSFASLIVTRHATTGVMQIYINSNAETFAYRTATSSVWSTWRRMFTSDNLLDTPTETSGAPTGGAMFRGTNSNGEYQMFADGTMICTHTLTSSASAATTWTFPASFAAQPDFFAAQPNADAPRAGSISGVSSTGLSFGSWNTSDGSRVASSVYLQARGVWFT